MCRAVVLSFVEYFTKDEKINSNEKEEKKKAKEIFLFDEVSS